jgi:quercetin dioxygenase-like cupin family protein
MSDRGIRTGQSKAVLFLLLILACSVALTFAFAAEPRQERTLFYTADDPRLEWGPCPDFMPDGCAIAVLQGDPAQRNADVFFRVPPNSVLPRHWHTSAERMILVSGELHLTFDSHQPQVARPGTYIYGAAKLPHEGRCAAGDPCILFIAFEEPVDAVPGSPPRK